MFYYLNQSCTPSFLIGLVKTKSDFIFRSVETGLERWALVWVPVISVDAYPFSAFSDLTCHLEDTGSGVFWKCRDSFSAMLLMEVRPYSYF